MFIALAVEQAATDRVSKAKRAVVAVERSVLKGFQHSRAA